MNKMCNFCSLLLLPQLLYYWWRCALYSAVVVTAVPCTSLFAKKLDEALNELQCIWFVLVLCVLYFQNFVYISCFYGRYLSSGLAVVIPFFNTFTPPPLWNPHSPIDNFGRICAECQHSILLASNTERFVPNRQFPLKRIHLCTNNMNEIGSHSAFPGNVKWNINGVVEIAWFYFLFFSFFLRSCI